MARKALCITGIVLACVVGFGLLAAPVQTVIAETRDVAAVAAADQGGLALPEGPLANRPFGKLIRSGLRRLVALRGELNVTEDQKGQIGKVLKGRKGEIIAAIKEVRDAHRKLDDAVTAQNADEKAIRSAAADMAKAIGDAGVLKAKVRAEVRAVLTDEQKAALDRFRADMRNSVDQAITEAENLKE